MDWIKAIGITMLIFAGIALIPVMAGLGLIALSVFVVKEYIAYSKEQDEEEGQ